MIELCDLTLSSVIKYARARGFGEILRVPMSRTGAGQWPSLTFMFSARNGLLLELENMETDYLHAGLIYGNQRLADDPVVFPIRFRFTAGAFEQALGASLPELDRHVEYVKPWQVDPNLRLVHTMELGPGGRCTPRNCEARRRRLQMFPTHIRKLITPCLQNK
jgi:hypothetical protein